MSKPGYDLIIRGGDVIDGTGAPRQRADVAVSDGLIVRIAPQIDGDAADEIDAGGLIVAPGFIDSHTHLEGQLFWDPIAGPSSRHGSTTVILGSCGLSLAPLHPDDREFGAALMSAVEQIPQSILMSQVPFDWTGFDGFMRSLEQLRTGVNVGAFVGYSVVRHAAMGERAFTDAALPEDLDLIETLLVQALDAGALGVSFNRATYDKDHHGRLMAGWDADWSEIRRAAAVVGRYPGAMLQVIPSWANLADGWSERNEAEVEAWTSILVETGCRLVWSAVSERHYAPQMEATRRVRGSGGRMTAGIHSVPLYSFATFAAPCLFASTQECRFLFDLTPTDRLAALRDPAVRERIRASMGPETFVGYPLQYVSETGEESLGIARTYSWSNIYYVGSPPERFVVGESISEMATRLGKHPVDVVLDAALASGLQDVFVVFVYGNLPDVTEQLLMDPATVISSNDTGAHLMLMAQTQTTHLLSHWVRESGVLTMEQAVHLLTGRQASAFGIEGRGVLAEGMAADIVVFDADEVGPQAPAIAHDLPGGGSRFVCDSLGIRRVIVNGSTILRDDQPTGALPGSVVRPNDRAIPVSLEQPPSGG